MSKMKSALTETRRYWIMAALALGAIVVPAVMSIFSKDPKIEVDVKANTSPSGSAQDEASMRIYQLPSQRPFKNGQRADIIAKIDELETENIRRGKSKGRSDSQDLTKKDDTVLVAILAAAAVTAGVIIAADGDTETPLATEP